MKSQSLGSAAPAAPAPAPAARRAFASLSNGDFRLYFVGTTLALMADNIEHVISYWVIFQKFHSPALGGFAVISHWVPYLLLAGFTGALADRYDVRRLIQAAMLLFMGVSVTWGVLFFTDTLALWKAMTLLVIHGLAGVIWIPASQVLIHRLVSAEQLVSAVRLNSTGRYLGFLVGPALGAGLLLVLGPAYGILVNAAIYLPLFAWLIAAPAGPRAGRGAPAAHGAGDLLATMRLIANHPVLASMTLLVGAASFFVGTSYQAQMPGFARDLGATHVDFSYSMLLAADAAGGLAGGLVLESRGLLPPRPRTAFLLALIWSAALLAFARAHLYALAVAALFVAGFAELGFNAMAQTLVQINAPPPVRGRVIGVFSMAALGLRTFSGLCVGLLGQRIGIHRSLGLSAVVLLVLYSTAFAVRGVRDR